MSMSIIMVCLKIVADILASVLRRILCGIILSIVPLFSLYINTILEIPLKIWAEEAIIQFASYPPLTNTVRRAIIEITTHFCEK